MLSGFSYRPPLSLTKAFLFFYIALAYGYILSQLPDIHFKDFSNYLVYADESWVTILRYARRGLLQIFSNEPVWLLINVSLRFFLEPYAVVRTIIFVSASSVAWLVLRHYPKHFVWLILFLLLPQVIKNYLIHLRQGVAIAVFLWGWFSTSRSLRWLLLALTPLIHASFFFVIFLLWLTCALKRVRFASDLRIITFVLAGVGMSVGLNFFAQLLGARQANTYDFGMTDVSGLGFVLWLIVLVTFLVSGRAYLRAHALETGIVTFYLGTYWLIEVTARIFESGLMLVLLAGLALPGWRRTAFLTAVLGSGSIIWLMRLGRPALGFAGG